MEKEIVVTEPCPFHLRTEQRAQERQEFDAEVERRKQEAEAARQRRLKEKEVRWTSLILKCVAESKPLIDSGRSCSN